MHNKKATRMKPPTILVAIGAPPSSIGAPTADSVWGCHAVRHPPA